MNSELIGSLHQQAIQEIANQRTRGDESRLNRESYAVQGMIQQAFAALILRQCLDIVSGVNTDHYTADGVASEIEERISKRFGV